VYSYSSSDEDWVSQSAQRSGYSDLTCGIIHFKLSLLTTLSFAKTEDQMDMEKFMEW
jgi:hypothetical protein